MFGKRRGPPADMKPVNDDEMIKTLPIRRRIWDLAQPGIQTRLRSADKGYLDFFEVDQSLVDFVNILCNRARIPMGRVYPKFRQAYYFSYYMAQVNNGGHRQFIVNSSPRRVWYLEEALMAAHAMGAPEYAEVLVDYLGWLRQNPEKIDQLSDWSDKAVASPLYALDDRFFAHQKGPEPVHYLVEWIATWPEVAVLEDDAYDAEIERILRLVPSPAVQV